MLLFATHLACTSADGSGTGVDSAADSVDSGDSGGGGDTGPHLATDAVWDGDVVPVYRITFPTDDWAAQLEALLPAENCADRPYLEAAVAYENPVAEATACTPP